MYAVKFSVVIPAYNAENCIQRSLNSLCEQEFRNFEVVVVNDGSTDATLEKIKPYEDHLSIQTITQANKGVSAARNVGISYANGEYICFLDADDIYYPNHLSLLEKMITYYPLESFFMTGYQNILLTGKVTSYFLKKLCQEVQMFDNFFKLNANNGTFFNTNCMCIRKDVFQVIGGFEEGTAHGEDTDMWYRIGCYYNVVVSKVCTNARFRDYSVATKHRSYNYNWIFESRLNRLYEDPEIPQERKEALKTLMEERKISKVRNKLLQGKRGDAWRYLRQIDVSRISLKRYLITAICFVVPSSVLNRAVKRRDHGYYQE